MRHVQQFFVVKGNFDATVILLVASVNQLGGRRGGGLTTFDASTFQKLEDASNFISGVLEVSTEYSIIAADLDGCIRLWNRCAWKLFGCEHSETIRQLPASELFVDGDIKAGVSGTIADEAARAGKWEGLVVGLLLVAKDIADEQKRATALANTQLYTRSLIESNIDALMTTNASGTITDVNEQMTVLAGRTRDELIGAMFKDHEQLLRVSDTGPGLPELEVEAK